MFGVQQHVKQRKLNLPHGLQAGLKVFGCQHFVEQRAGQGFAGVDMGGHVLQHSPFPTKVFHKLAGQFYGVPFHTAYSRHISFVHLREQVVQAVSKFMEQGDDVFVREQCGMAVDAFCKVAHQMRYRGLQFLGVGAQPAGTHIVHPRAAAFALA